MKQRICIIGAGYAGVLIAKKLEKKAKKLGDVQITIIDRNPFHTMLTELHEVAAHRVDEDSIKINLKRVFAGRKVDVVMDTVTSVDYEKKEVVCETQSLPYDYLVLASGSKPTFFNVQGAEENVFTLWSFEDAVRIREHIVNVFRAAACETDLDKKRRLLTFFVVGAGFTGVEMAGELAELAPILCEKYEIDPSLVRICDVDFLDRVCTVLPPKLSAKVEKRLAKMNVNVMLKTSIVNVGADFIEYKRGDSVIREAAETVIWTAGIEGSDIAQASAELGQAGRGRIQTDGYLRSLNKKEVYVAGDNIFYIPEGETNPVPQMVENCEACADAIAHNLICDLGGSGKHETYAPKFHGVMVCVGGRYGVAHVGMPGKMFGLPSFLAMLSKHFINIIYFIQVLGWNKIFSYVKHEFFTIRNCRSFVGGHFSNRGPNFFGVPLRIYLGCYWLYEGVVKVGEGWLQSAKLTDFFTYANLFYDRLLYPHAFEQGADAASAATGAVADTAAAATGAVADTAAAATGAVADTVAAATGAVADTVAAATGAVVEAVSPVLLDWNILNLAKVILVNSGDYAFKFQVGLVDIMVNSLIIPNEGLQMVFQFIIVISEILIGLALIGGLFTTLSGAYSVVLQFMFVTTTGLYMSSWWMIFAGIAVMFGAGRVFSLDYYVIPWLKKKWKNISFVKKWYIYND